jgi:pilus assembly protein CpaB
MSRVVVSNVEVLTAGTNYDQEEARKEGKPMRSSVVTLAVTPEDSERIALAGSEGKVILALRNPFDRRPTETAGVRMGNLMGSVAPPPVEKVVKGRRVVVPQPAPAAAPVSKIYTVEAIRAAKRTEEPVR